MAGVIEGQYLVLVKLWEVQKATHKVCSAILLFLLFFLKANDIMHAASCSIWKLSNDGALIRFSKNWSYECIRFSSFQRLHKVNFKLQSCYFACEIQLSRGCKNITIKQIEYRCAISKTNYTKFHKPTMQETVVTKLCIPSCIIQIGYVVVLCGPNSMD